VGSVPGHTTGITINLTGGTQFHAPTTCHQAIQFLMLELPHWALREIRIMKRVLYALQAVASFLPLPWPSLRTSPLVTGRRNPSHLNATVNPDQPIKLPDHPADHANFANPRNLIDKRAYACPAARYGHSHLRHPTIPSTATRLIAGVQLNFTVRCRPCRSSRGSVPPASPIFNAATSFTPPPVGSLAQPHCVMQELPTNPRYSAARHPLSSLVYMHG